MGSSFGFLKDSAVRESIPPAFVLLHDADNVLVCCRKVRAGDVVDIDAKPFIMKGPVEVGHKIAREDLAVGDKVMRYNAPIGSITLNVPAGAHIHTHNLKSDYIPSHGRDAVQAKDDK